MNFVLRNNRNNECKTKPIGNQQVLKVQKFSVCKKQLLSEKQDVNQKQEVDLVSFRMKTLEVNLTYMLEFQLLNERNKYDNYSSTFTSFTLLV